MKSTICILLALICVALCFAGCSNVPKEPATTTVVNQSFVNPYGDTVTPPANADPTSGTTAPVKYLETVNDVEFVVSDYNVYGNSVAAIKDIKLEFHAFSAFEVTGIASVEIQAIGSRKDDMKIGYIAYDKDGKMVRKSFLMADLEGVSKGDVVEDCIFDFPENTVKVEFFDYTEK